MEVVYQPPDSGSYEEQYRLMLEDNKKLKIDISSLQLSNRSLVNQNRDEKKKVMDLRLQIADLESKLKALDTINASLAEVQTQMEKLRTELDSEEARAKEAEKRCREAEKSLKLKESMLEKATESNKELEEKFIHTNDDRDRLSARCSRLETQLAEAVERGKNCEKYKEQLDAKTELMEKLLSEEKEAGTGSISESGIAAANEFFKSQIEKAEQEVEEAVQAKKEMEVKYNQMDEEKQEMAEKLRKQIEETESILDKCSVLETRIKELADKKTKVDPLSNRLIGPSLPPWIAPEKPSSTNSAEKLAGMDINQLRSKVLMLERQANELNQLLEYREDVILRIHEEISKKAARLEAAEVEKSGLMAQVQIIKRELAEARGESTSSLRRGLGANSAGESTAATLATSGILLASDVEPELERLRGKRDREYQRRKRVEADLDEVEKELAESRTAQKTAEEKCVQLEAKLKAAENAAEKESANNADKARLADLQTHVNQLRMDNESKRASLFDLRSKIDEKMAQIEKMTADIKNKERTTADLSTQLATTQMQLSATSKELDSVRCKAVRGGPEADRLLTDLTSVQLTNKALSTQLIESRRRLIASERHVRELSLRVADLSKEDKSEIKNLVIDAAWQKVEGRLPLAELKTEVQDGNKSGINKQVTTINVCTKCGKEGDLNGASVNGVDTAHDDVHTLETRLTEADERITQLKSEASNERTISTAASNQVQSLTQQTTRLESEVCALRMQLSEEESRTRLLTNQQSQLTAKLKSAEESLDNTSPTPAKRTRQTRSNSGSKSSETEPIVKNEEKQKVCAICEELRQMLKEVDIKLQESLRREASLTSMIGELRTKLADAQSRRTRS